ncbi:MAG: hypothetical protein WAO23_04450 [Dethiobacteria bacterium]
MSMPVITPSTTSPCQAITDLLESIALQEAGLAHIINAEGEKIQAALEMTDVTIADLLAINESVAAVLRKVIKLQMVIEFKIEEISELTPCVEPA